MTNSQQTEIEIIVAIINRKTHSINERVGKLSTAAVGDSEPMTTSTEVIGTKKALTELLTAIDMLDHLNKDK